MNRKKIQKIFDRFKSVNPYPTTELICNTPFELLVAVILSAQATDNAVNLATKSLFKIADTPEKINALGILALKKYIKTIGLYNTKAKNIMATCKILIEKHASNCPKTREDLEALPGVGRKTANVILNTCYGEPTIAVDTHIFRVAQRIGLAKGTTPLMIEKQLLEKIPPNFLRNAHHWLVLHGRYVCISRRPKCYECLICDLCEYPDKNLKPAKVNS